MKERYHIISDGSCDLPQELVEEKNITVVPFYVSFDNENYLKENAEIGIRDFYQQMVDRKGVYPKSSMPSAQDYVEAFMPYAREGVPVICICITTKFSGSMQSALSARGIVRESYSDAKITVIDATVNTVLQGLYVLEAAALRDSGMEYEAVVARLEEIKSTGRIFYGRRYGILKAWRTHRQGIRRCRQYPGDPACDHAEGGRDFSFRYRQRQEAHYGKVHRPADGLSGGERT